MNFPWLRVLACAVIVAGAPREVAAQSCAKCISPTICAAISEGTGSSRCWVENGQCHEAFDICVITDSNVKPFLRTDLAAVDGRAVPAIPVSPTTWLARSCPQGARFAFQAWRSAAPGARLASAGS